MGAYNTEFLLNDISVHHVVIVLMNLPYTEGKQYIVLGTPPRASAVLLLRILWAFHSSAN